MIDNFLKRGIFILGNGNCLNFEIFISGGFPFGDFFPVIPDFRNSGAVYGDFF